MSAETPEPKTEIDPTTAQRLKPPQVPDHELLRRVGGGSYGEVWLARSALGTLRAVKLVTRRSFDHERPYEREFEGIQQFEPISRSHEGLVDVLQVGRHDAEGYFYYVMELADDAAGNPKSEVRNPKEVRNPTAATATPENQLRHSDFGLSSDFGFRPSDFATQYVPKTLKREIYQRGRLPFDECLDLALSLTQAIGHPHKHGLLHRDIKPSNIIFVNGVPKLADVGLVAAVGQTLSLVGTEGFIPPEGPGTPQADLYSLGKVLYEASTGRDRQDFPELPTAVRGSPDEQRFLELNAVIVRACAPDVRQRYGSAEEMLTDLLLVQSGKSVQRLHSIERRLRLATRVGAAAALTLLLATGAYFYQARQTRLITGIAQQNAQLHQRAREQVLRLHVANGTRLVDEGDLLSADSRRMLTCPKGNTAAILDAATGQFAAPPLRHPEWVLWGAWSPDDRSVATAGADGAVRLWDASTGEQLTPPLRHGNEVVRVAFSPDGLLLATASADRTARLWDATTGEPVTPPLQHEGPVAHVAFSPDRHWLAPASEDGTARVWGLPATQLGPEELESLSQLLSAQRIHPTGAALEPVNSAACSNAWRALRAKLPLDPALLSE
jgi:hypothetical protein